MPMYPPSDFVALTIPVGAVPPGCGREHRRPHGPDGVPVHPWALSCPDLCEAWLRQHDDRWVPSPDEIKPTFDEAKQAERLKERGSADRDSIMLAALARIAGLELPASMARGLPAAAPVTALLACPSCSSAQSAGQSFCGACGSPMRAEVPAAAITGGVS